MSDTQSFQLRTYKDGDHDAVVSLWETVFPDAPPRNDPRKDIARKVAEDRELFVVATVAARVVGTAMAGFDGHRGWLHLLAIHPEQQGNGIGEALVERAVALLDARGCPKLNLQVRGDNAAVAAFYEKLGFKVEDRISMGRVLSSGEP